MGSSNASTRYSKIVAILELLFFGYHNPVLYRIHISDFLYFRSFKFLKKMFNFISYFLRDFLGYFASFFPKKYTYSLLIKTINFSYFREVVDIFRSSRWNWFPSSSAYR